MNVATILKHKGGEIVSVAQDAGLPEIAAIITSRRIGAVLVLEAGARLAGIVSERDVVRAVAEHGAAAMHLTASDIMTRAVTTAEPSTTVDEAMEIMDAGYFRHLPVLDKGALVGIVSVRDAVRAHIQEQANEVDSLKSFVFRGAHASGLR